MGILRAIGWGISGLLFLITLFVVVGFGVAGGTYWYWTGHPDVRYEFNIPVGDEEITLTAYNEKAVSPEKTEALLEQGDLQAQLQFWFGPFDWKLIGLRVGADIPVEELVDAIVEQVQEEAGGGW